MSIPSTSFPVVVTQKAEYQLPQYWVFGMELLESKALSFFIHEVLGSLVGPIRNRTELETLLDDFQASAGPLANRGVYELLTKRLIKSLRKRPDKWLEFDPGLFAHVTAMSTHVEPAYVEETWIERMNPFASRYRHTPDSYTLEIQAILMRGPRPTYPGDDISLRYVGTLPQGDCLCLSALSTGQQTRLVHDETWITPLVMRMPIQVLRHLASDVRGLIPAMSHHNNTYNELFRNILDWLSSEAAPKNIKRLDPLDAAKQARAWHERGVRQVGDTIQGLIENEIAGFRGTTGRAFSRNETSARGFFGAQYGQSLNVLAGGPKLLLPEDGEHYTLIWKKGEWAVFALESEAAFRSETMLMEHCIGRSNRYIEEKKHSPNRYIPMTLRKSVASDQGLVYVEAGATFDYYRERGFTQLKGEHNRPLNDVASLAFLAFLTDLRKSSVLYLSKLPTQEKLGPTTIKVEHEARLHGQSDTLRSYLTLPPEYKDHPIVQLITPKFTFNGNGRVGELFYSRETMGYFTFDGTDWIPVSSPSISRLDEHRAAVVGYDEDGEIIHRIVDIRNITTDPHV